MRTDSQLDQDQTRTLLNQEKFRWTSLNVDIQNLKCASENLSKIQLIFHLLIKKVM